MVDAPDIELSNLVRGLWYVNDPTRRALHRMLCNPQTRLDHWLTLADLFTDDGRGDDDVAVDHFILATRLHDLAARWPRTSTDRLSVPEQHQLLHRLSDLAREADSILIVRWNDRNDFIEVMTAAGAELRRAWGL